MKKIEDRSGEFMEQFKKSILDSFPPALKIKVEFYLGEDDKGTRGLYFLITSSFGQSFTRIKPLRRGQVPTDVEEQFINECIDELVVAGITLFNIRAFESISPARVENETKSEIFRHHAPRKMLFLN